MPELGIIIPTYNYAHTLERALYSALACGDDHTHLRVLVVDDGSIDDTRALIAGLHEAGLNFEYLYQSNSGPAAARNLGLNKLEAEFVMFLDADDELQPESVQQGLATISSSPETDLLIAGHDSVFNKGRRYAPPGKISNSCETNFRRYLLDKTINMSNGAMIIRKKSIGNIRFPEKFRNSEDIPFFAKLLAKSTVISVQLPTVTVYKHNDSLRHNLIYAREIGEQIVDNIFNEAELPEWSRKYEKSYRSQRLLSLFRTHYLSGDRDAALKLYKKAIYLKFSSLFKWAYLKKYLKLTLFK